MQAIELEDEQLFRTHLKPFIYDYTWPNVYAWRNGFRWELIEDCLCVFADKPMTLLMPPMGLRTQQALDKALKLCEVKQIEYVSKEFLPLLKEFKLVSRSGDYVYSSVEIAELAGLSTRRREKREFIKQHPEAKLIKGCPKTYCMDLLEQWASCTKQDQDSAKLRGDVQATKDILQHVERLKLVGASVVEHGEVLAFTLGEQLQDNMCSVIVEKTKPGVKGLSQFIFSEFIKHHWLSTLWCNAGDDWELEGLRYAKESYHPVFRLEKWTAHV